MDIFILRFWQKDTIKMLCLLIVSHIHCAEFLGRICFTCWRFCLQVDEVFLSVCLSPPPQSQSISLPPPPSLSDLWNSCWEGPILSTMYHEVMLQLGLFKKWLMYFINYLFTYARPVSMTMLFLLMPYCCTLFQYPAMNILTSLGLNKPVGWKVWQYVTP